MSDLHARLLAHVDDLGDNVYQDGGMASALRTVVELHAPRVRIADDGSHCCPHCYDEPTWPCATIRAIARELGVEP